MSRRLLCLLVLAFAISPFALRAAEPKRPHLADPAHLLPLDPPAAVSLEQKLAAFEHTAGITILVELHAKSPPDDEDKVPGAYMHALAAKLGVAQHGVLAVYFSDEDDWRLWIGDDLAARFAGQPGTAAELTKNNAIHDAKEALFAAAKAQADAAFTKLQSAAPAGHTPTVNQRLGLQTEALLEHLTAKFVSP